MLGRSIRIVSALVRTSLQTGMQYRADFLADLLVGAIRTLATAAPLALVYSRTDAIAGWTLPDAALVMAMFLLMEGLVGSFIEPNLAMVVEGIREGTLDLVLTKPADAQLLVSLRTIAPTHLWDVLGAVLLGGWALSQRDVLPGVDDVVVAVVLAISGLASLYALWILAICLSFWFVRVDNLRFLLWSASDAGQWPITVFQGWVRAVLTYVIPVAVMTSFPALAMSGQWDATLVGTGLGIAAAFLALSRWMWLRALASYTSASS